MLMAPPLIWDVSMILRLHYAASLILFIIQLVYSQEHHDCVTSMEELGYCADIRQCPLLLSLQLNFKHTSGIDNFLHNSSCVSNNLFFNVCCPLPHRPPLPTLPPEFIPPNLVHQTSPMLPSFFFEMTKYGPLLPLDCGSTVKLNEENSGAGSFPWLALLGYGSVMDQNIYPKRKPVWRCGGTLISLRHILTTGHCITPDLYVIRLGDDDLDPYSQDRATPVDISIDKVDIHPQYDDGNSTNDIAVIRLWEDVRYTDLIRPICLPVPNDIYYEDFVGKKLHLAGWGLRIKSQFSFKTLRHTSITAQTNSACNDTISKSRNTSWQTATVNGEDICIGGKNTEICVADSGGPLMKSVREGNSTIWYMVGVNSAGHECEPSSHTTYIRIANRLTFIRSLLI